MFWYRGRAGWLTLPQGAGVDLLACGIVSWCFDGRGGDGISAPRHQRYSSLAKSSLVLGASVGWAEAAAMRAGRMKRLKCMVAVGLVLVDGFLGVTSVLVRGKEGQLWRAHQLSLYDIFRGMVNLSRRSLHRTTLLKERSPTLDQRSDGVYELTNLKHGSIRLAGCLRCHLVHSFCIIPHGPLNSSGQQTTWLPGNNFRGTSSP